MGEKHRVVLIIPLDVESIEEQWEIIQSIAKLNLPIVTGTAKIAVDDKAEEVETLIKSWDDRDE